MSPAADPKPQGFRFFNTLLSLLFAAAFVASLVFVNEQQNRRIEAELGRIS
jgi:hypothetical protein